MTGLLCMQPLCNSNREDAGEVAADHVDFFYAVLDARGSQGDGVTQLPTMYETMGPSCLVASQLLANLVLYSGN